MKIAHITSVIPDKISGPKNSVTLLAKYLTKCGNYESIIFSTKSAFTFSFNGFKIHPISEMRIADYDFISLNGVYDLELMKCAREARKCKVKYAFSPRSGLMIRSLKKSFYKKIPFLFFNALNIYGAELIFFLTEEEKRGSLVIPVNRSAICGNIVDNTPSCIQGRKKKVIRFIGRLDINHKGLDILLGAISQASKELRESAWSVCLHGPDHRDGLKELKRIASRMGVDDIVSFHDAVFQDEKFKLLRESSIFIHTSRYEGQPQAVMEAMAYGNVILITPGTNMTSIVADANCGITCASSVEGVAEGILKLIRMPQNELRSMQSNAHDYARRRFSGESVANCFLNSLRSLGYEPRS